jgi:hypothetical protein
MTQIFFRTVKDVSYEADDLKIPSSILFRDGENYSYIFPFFIQQPGINSVILLIKTECEGMAAEESDVKPFTCKNLTEP